MAYYDDNDVATWGAIDQDTDDLDAMARLYVYDTVTKNIDIAEESGEPVPNTLREWSDVAGEELAWDYQQGDWITEDIFDRLCGRVDALLPFFLENYEPIKKDMIWD